MGDGSDHWAFGVDGAFIARVRKQPDEHTAATVEREAALLEMLSRVSRLTVAQVVAAEPRAGLIVYRRLPGRSLFEKPAPEPGAIAEALADFVAAIHGVPSETVEPRVQRDEYPLSGYLTEAASLMNQIATRLTNAQRSRVELFLASPPPRTPSIQRCAITISVPSTSLRRKMGRN